MTEQTDRRERWEAHFRGYDAYDYADLATIGMAAADEELAEQPTPTDRATVLREAANARRMADEAQQQPAAHPTTTAWICEAEECDGQWMFLGASPDRSVIEERIARQQKRFPAWADGTPVRRRIVRKTTTYTVEPTP